MKEKCLAILKRIGGKIKQWWKDSEMPCKLSPDDVRQILQGQRYLRHKK
jgi:hypothetical protein